MLNPQVIMNLLPLLCIGVDLTGHSRWVGKRFMADAELFPQSALSMSAFHSETNEFHNGLSIFSCLLQIRVKRGVFFRRHFEQPSRFGSLGAPSQSGDRAKRCLSEG